MNSRTSIKLISLHNYSHFCDFGKLVMRWPQCLDSVPLRWSFHAALMFCPSCHLSCSNNASVPHALHSSLQRQQTWPCMERPSVPGTASWKRSQPLQCEDNLPARICGEDNKERERDLLKLNWGRNRGKHWLELLFPFIISEKQLTLQRHWW